MKERFNFAVVGPVNCLDAGYIDLSAPCEPWHGRSFTKDGYAFLSWHGRGQLAHRVVYALSRGVSIESLKGVTIRHICDRRDCIAHSHLLAGTKQDNSNDMKRRGRSNLGERHPRALLSEGLVRVVRAAYKPRCRDFGAAALARKFNVSVRAIRAALNGRTWAHVI